jgi:hypothetical protein
MRRLLRAVGRELVRQLDELATRLECSAGGHEWAKHKTDLTKLECQVCAKTRPFVPWRPEAPEIQTSKRRFS